MAFRASGIQENGPSLVSALRSANFLRSSTAGAAALELYHDRLREGIAARLKPGAVQAIHSNLAESLVATGFDDPEVLFEHHHEAGQFEPAAARYALLSAEKASAALAFDRAATFWRGGALELVPHNGRREDSRSEVGNGADLGECGTHGDGGECLPGGSGGSGISPWRSIWSAARRLNSCWWACHVDRGLEVLLQSSRTRVWILVSSMA